jgi:predicted N-formylglutamate amidohydrolase
MSTRRRARPALLVTCEHGGNLVPERYRPLFEGHRAALDSHRGLDIGSLQMARDLARAGDAGLIATTTTRLLVDLNRSVGHRRLFSEITRDLPRAERARLLEAFYRPYRTAVEAAIAGLLTTVQHVIHVSTHSFTPELDGVTRTADVGLLYDPARHLERDFSARWQTAIERRCPDLRVRRNYPYRGSADGLTTALRRRFPVGRYAGIELEVNQRYPLSEEAAWRRLRRQIAAALVETLG